VAPASRGCFQLGPRSVVGHQESSAGAAGQQGGGGHLGKRGKRVSGTWQWSKELMQLDGGEDDPHSQAQKVRLQYKFIWNEYSKELCSFVSK